MKQLGKRARRWKGASGSRSERVTDVRFWVMGKGVFDRK